MIVHNYASLLTSTVQCHDDVTIVMLLTNILEKHSLCCRC